MEQKKLYKILDNIIRQAPSFKKDEDLMGYVLNEIIKYEEINILGGRIWKLNSPKNGYVLIEQMGDVDYIENYYEVKVADYPLFKDIGKSRSIIAKETDTYLKGKGINLYSATGIGERYKIRTRDESNYLYQYIIALNAKNIDDKLLNTLNIISTTLSSVLYTRNIELNARQNIADLEKAREIQKNILPEHEFHFGNYELFGISIPSRIVGGDFFDYLEFEDDERLGIAIGDAASKGISAAAQALYVSGALKMGIESRIKMTNMMCSINHLVHKTFPYERFVSLFYGEVYKDKKGLLLFVNAGHNKPIVLKSKDNSIEYLDSTGSVLGPSPNSKYIVDSTNLDINDIILLYTDGIVEATDEQFNFFGEENLVSALIENKNRPAKEICEQILNNVEVFSANGKYTDDRTLLVLKRIV
jgi:sigma-B regulation protein RsbU (phosphoserine phosphatase)